MGVGFGVGASVGEGRCGAVDLSVELPEEPELLPVFVNLYQPVDRSKGILPVTLDFLLSVR